MKTYLEVPFADKDKAKYMGARFDMHTKRWYVPDAVDIIPFLQWVPNLPKLSKKVKRAIGISALAREKRPPREIVDDMLKWARK